MTDEFERFAKALKAAKPAPNADRKADAIALARKKFDTAQEAASVARPIYKPTQNVSGIWTGVKTMFRSINLRPMLYTTSALCVAGLAFVVTPPMMKSPLTPVVVSENNVDVRTEELAKRENKEKKTLDNMQRQAATELEATLQVSNDVAAVKPSPSPRANNLGTLGDGNIQNRTSNFAPKKTMEGIAQSLVSEGIVSGDYKNAPTPQSNETFANDAPNPLKIVAEKPVSTFSIDVDTASYSYVRSAIESGHLPTSKAVRIEEMINYFPYEYNAPDHAEAPFSTAVSVFQTPWNPDTKILHIGIQGAKPEIENRPPLNLVFLIDTSGSMNNQNKLPLLKKSFRLLLNSLRPTDKVAIVTYAGRAGTVLEPTEASNKGKILDSLERLSSGGSTAGQAGLQQAYSLATSMQTDGSIGRVLLATDGDFNVGISDPDALKSFVEEKRDTGIYLSVLGFGRGNYRDDMMQTLAQNGNGTAAYIDTLAEAQKVLVDQLSGTIFPIANDVKIQVEFNPAQIAEYRLIGYETRILKREDFNNDRVDAGEIGAGHTVTAIYEITPVGSPAIKNTPLRYQEASDVTGSLDEYGYLKLRYKEPGDKDSKLIKTPISPTASALNGEVKFATAIAGFGQLLTQDKYLNGWTWDQAIDLAIEGKGSDPFGYRAEAIQLMRLAQSLN